MNALSVSQNVANRQHPCLPSKKGRWHGWYNFFACCTVFRYSCLYNSETIPSRDGGDCECVEAFTVALPSFQSLTPCTNPSKTALSYSFFVGWGSVCAFWFRIHAKPKSTHAKASLPCLPLPLHRLSPFPQPLQRNNTPSPHTTTLASLVKGRWIGGKAQTLTLLHLLAICSPFLYCKLFCRQDGGIATPTAPFPFLWHLR